MDRGQWWSMPYAITARKEMAVRSPSLHSENKERMKDEYEETDFRSCFIDRQIVELFSARSGCKTSTLLAVA